ncbi:substrate-binding domain-containing protein [Marinomonas pollencensis]|uniref:Monosaccharide ABC transporter substrate-binding protein (CUT2 family) n=1 Tax=Marinomonas pollencensis TaxID=491954 RepID=A0A3E0DEN3_9GAMM|nr:substrate-binding domain-containing protein [Marinomonas pollencensis]REG81043.1 monosaccharide ABC transporter substrate-binding protein (CUT2 family) [Marinomonas pollencensis]
MRRLPFKLFVIVMIGWLIPLQAANVQSFTMDSHHFYSLFPAQQSLSEQFSAVINAPPDPVDILQRRPVHITILLFGRANNLKNLSLVDAAQRRLNELKIDYRLETVYGKRNHYDVIEYEKLKRSRPDYVVMTELDMVQSRYIEQLLRDTHVKVIFYDMATPLSNWQYHAPFMYVGFDKIKVVNMLVSYLHRQLPAKAKIAAFLADSSALGDLRCDAFLDAMAALNRPIQSIQTMDSTRQSGRAAARVLLEAKSVDFIFSCTQNISDGVVSALKEFPNQKVRTNSWGFSDNELSNLTSQRVLVSTLFRWDDLAIAIAEGIKSDIEGEPVPKLYMARASLISSGLDLDSLKLLIGRAYRYSGEGL